MNFCEFITFGDTINRAGARQGMWAAIGVGGDGRAPERKGGGWKIQT